MKRTAFVFKNTLIGQSSWEVSLHYFVWKKIVGGGGSQSALHKGLGESKQGEKGQGGERRDKIAQKWAEIWAVRQKPLMK